jgi:hypothetical protein
MRRKHVAAGEGGETAETRSYLIPNIGRAAKAATAILGINVFLPIRLANYPCCCRRFRGLVFSHVILSAGSICFAEATRSYLLLPLSRLLRAWPRMLCYVNRAFWHGFLLRERIGAPGCVCDGRLLVGNCGFVERLVPHRRMLANWHGVCHWLAQS